jgi:hypothetical protein
MEIEKNGVSLARGHVPDDHALPVGGVEHRLFRLRQARRPRGSASALWKILNKALRHVKQRDEAAIKDERSEKPLHHQLGLRKNHNADRMPAAVVEAAPS